MAFLGAPIKKYTQLPAKIDTIIACAKIFFVCVQWRPFITGFAMQGGGGGGGGHIWGQGAGGWGGQLAIMLQTFSYQYFK